MAGNYIQAAKILHSLILADNFTVQQSNYFLLNKVILKILVTEHKL